MSRPIWVEGQNITIEYRFADGKADALPKLAVEVVQLRVDAIVTDSTPATQALPADEDATLPLYPGEEPLDEPAPHVTA